MKIKLIGGLHFNNVNNKITYMLSALFIDTLLLRDITWTQWDKTSPKKFYKILLHCKTFNRHLVGSKKSTLNPSIIGYNKYDASSEFVKYLSKFERVKSLKLTHSVYNQILDDTVEYHDGIKKPKYVSVSSDSNLANELSQIVYHSDGDIKIIFHNHYSPTDRGMAYLICLHLAIRYMKNKKLIKYHNC